MDCSSCAKTIEQHFQKMQNVQTVTVSFARGEMEIDHQLDARQVQSELNKIGFDGYVKGKKTSEAPVRSFEGISLILSGILIGLGLLIQTSGVAYLPNVLYGIALILSGGRVFRSAYYAVRARSLDMNVLMRSSHRCRMYRGVDRGSDRRLPLCHRQFASESLPCADAQFHSETDRTVSEGSLRADGRGR